MNRMALMCTFALLMLMTFKRMEVEAGKKVVIHIPYHVKNLKHTHTIYKIIHKPEWKKERRNNPSKNNNGGGASFETYY